MDLFLRFTNRHLNSSLYVYHNGYLNIMECLQNWFLFAFLVRIVFYIGVYIFYDFQFIERTNYFTPHLMNHPIFESLNLFLCILFFNSVFYWDILKFKYGLKFVAHYRYWTKGDCIHLLPIFITSLDIMFYLIVLKHILFFFTHAY